MVEVEGRLLHETDAAILINPWGDVDAKVWIPKSQIRNVEHTRVEDTRIVKMLVPEWLAIAKGLV